MKKTKKVISCFLLLLPLALPAACSPVSTAGREKKERDDEAEQLRIVVERYFQQQAETQARQTVTVVPAGRPTPPQAAVVQPEKPPGEEVERLRVAVEEYLEQEEQGAALSLPAEDEREAAPAESEAELKEELSALEKTGEWSADESQVQCGIGPAPVAPAVKPGPEPVKKTACEFPLVHNRQVQFYLDLFQGQQRKNFRRWLERAARYLPSISKELKAAGLPEELAYLAMIESGFNPSAYSPSHASGLWQFIPGTARSYGLRVDSWTDERRDPEKATKAAIAYLKALHKHFDDWQLAVAAYNAGEGAVEQGLKKYKVSNFWDLARHNHLRLETKRYVPQLMAAVMIARNPEQYGFSGLRQERPLRYDVVKVPAGIALKAVAASASLAVGELRALNNELLRDQVPAAAKGGYLLKVPAGSSGLIAANLPKVRSVAAADCKTHTVAKNETLKEISRKYSVSMTDLLKVNDLRSAALKTGQQLRIPFSSERYALAEGGQQRAADSGRQTVTHRLGKGETLAEVAKKYKVSAASIMDWNKIADARRVKAGRQLRIQLQQPEAGLEKTASAAPAETAGMVELSVAGKKQRPGLQAADKKPAAVAAALGASGGNKTAEVSYYHVRSGDSLWSIAKKLQVTAKEIRRWNSLIGNLLRPGTKLIIKNG